MNQSKIRVEMLKCAKGCRANVMIGGGAVSLMWKAGSHWHQSWIERGQCTINSKEFLAALEGARIGLIY